MDISRLPEPLRSRAEELERRPLLEKVRDFLGAHVNDMEDLDEIRLGMRVVAASGTFGLKRDLRALDEFFAEPRPPGLLSTLMAWDANWVLDDPSDEGAAAFLRQVVDMLRDVIAEAEWRRAVKVRAGGVRELLVVRHGESTANAAFARAEAEGLVAAGIEERDADVPLSEVGRAQAAGLGRWLAELPDEGSAEVALCSPYRRARQTLQIAFDEVRAAGRAVPEVIGDDRLRDRETGTLELLTRAAIDERFPAEAARRALAGEFEYRPPGGESMMDVAGRLREFLGDVSVRFAGRRVLVMAHDAVVLMLRQVIEGLSIHDLRRVVAAGPVRNASVTRWVRDEGELRLREYNTVPAVVH